MADSLQRAVPLTPFRPSASAWNRMLDAARAEDFGAGVRTGTETPHCLVRVRNDSGGALAAFSVLKLGASVLDVTAPLRVSPTPMFVGTTPAAATDAFAILVEPAAADKFGLAAVAGVVPCVVNITDAGHGYAAPGTTAAKLVSAASGPARILDRETGTGDKKAVVLLGGSAAPAFAGARVYDTNSQVIGSGAWAQVTFASEDYDTDGYHSTSVNTTRITVPADGYYQVGAGFGFSPSGTGYRAARIIRNGGTAALAQVSGLPIPTYNWFASLAGAELLTAGDYLELSVWQDSGGSLSSIALTDLSPVLWIERRG